MTDRHRPLQWIPALLLLAFAATSQAADSAAGKSLVQGSCNTCHGNEVYTRADRRVQTRSGLTTQVQRCQLALDLNWFEEEVESAAEYLNRQFYHFK